MHNFMKSLIKLIPEHIIFPSNKFMSNSDNQFSRGLRLWATFDQGLTEITIIQQHILSPSSFCWQSIYRYIYTIYIFVAKYIPNQSV